MTADKQTPGHVAKPFTPTLSAAFHRSNKSPLTPKLATPSGYRTPKRLTPADPPSSARTDPDSLLSANVTPRSGSRTTRRDGFSNAPSNGHSSPHAPYVQASVHHGSTVGSYRTERSPVRAGGRLDPWTRAKPNEPHQLSRSNSASDGASPMFFHASDARSTTSVEEPRPRPAKAPAKPPSQTTFIYANGAEEPKSEPVESTAYKRRSTGLSRSVVGKPSPGASPRILSPNLGHATPRLSDGLLPSDGSSEVGSHVQSPPLGSFSPRPLPAPRHFKSSSVDSGQGGTATSPREGLGLGLRPSPILVSPGDKLDGGLASEPIPGLRPRIFSNGSTASADTFASAQQSPVKENSGPKDDAAATARTERKIMDLEISNSSLLAINRTLEREMRKQNAELRRFRRLSRSGRLSVAPSTRSVSGTSLGIMSELDEGSERSSAHGFPEEMSDFSDSESTGEDVMSPGSLADHDARHQARDEKRFFVDLAKHQELLADSQRMNQSLKRCLGWTEELISEAKKALEYNVHVNDVKLGGRVLSPEELNEIGEIARDMALPDDDGSDSSDLDTDVDMDADMDVDIDLPANSN